MRRSLRAFAVRISKENRLRVPDGTQAADVVQNRGFARRPGRLFFLDHNARSLELISRVFAGESEPIGTEMPASLYKCVGVTWTKNRLLGQVIATRFAADFFMTLIHH
jgi:hypothetical protein